jgi:hypothetical protein
MKDIVSIKKMQPWEAATGRGLEIGLGVGCSPSGATAFLTEDVLRGANPSV